LEFSSATPGPDSSAVSLGEPALAGASMAEPGAAASLTEARPERTRDRVASRRKAKRDPLKAVLMACGTIAGVLLLGGVAMAFYIGMVSFSTHDVSKAVQKVLTQKAHEPGPPQNILILGSDIRKNEIRAGVKASRSDTIMLLHVDPKLKKVWILSIPRDSRVAIDGHGMEKVNAAYFYGGAPLAITTVKELTGLPINGYVEIGFESFKELVDAIGGVWVTVPKPPGAPYIDDIMAANHDESARIVKPGYQRLDGKHALTYVRARHQFTTQDHERIVHQQAFIRALMAQTVRFQNVFKIPQLIDIFRRNVRTSMSLQDMTELALDMRGVNQRSLDATQVPGVDQHVGGVWYFVPDLERLKVLADRMGTSEPFKGVETTQTAVAAVPGAGAISATVKNGTSNTGWGHSMAARLKALGFKVGAVSTAKQTNYVTTLVLYKAGHQEQATKVRDALGFGATQQSTQVSFTSDVLVVVGSDFKPAGQ
jgi:polyisoprenyl-teichoic acid--peptidoglycan teichoic acid transferase